MAKNPSCRHCHRSGRYTALDVDRYVILICGECELSRGLEVLKEVSCAEGHVVPGVLRELRSVVPDESSGGATVRVSAMSSKGAKGRPGVVGQLYGPVDPVDELEDELNRVPTAVERLTAAAQCFQAGDYVAAWIGLMGLRRTTLSEQEAGRLDKGLLLLGSKGVPSW